MQTYYITAIYSNILNLYLNIKYHEIFKILSINQVYNLDFKSAFKYYFHVRFQYYSQLNIYVYDLSVIVIIPFTYKFHILNIGPIMEHIHYFISKVDINL